MKSVFIKLLFLLSSVSFYLVAQAQSNPQPSQPPGTAQQPSAQQPSGTQPMQQPPQQAPEIQQPPLNTPTGQQPPPDTAPAQESNAAQTLQVYAYPKTDQPPEKQAQDESECFQWAHGQSAPQQEDAQQQGQPTQQGSKHGKKKAQEKAEEQQQQQAQQVQATENIKRAYSACMESHNYTVR